MRAAHGTRPTARRPLRLSLPLVLTALLAPGVLTGCDRAERAPSAMPSAAAPAGETSPLLSVPPDSLVWTQPDVTDARRQADIQDCYALSRARVRTGQQIDRDIEGNLNQRGSYTQAQQFKGRLSDFEAENRQEGLFSDCMASKGYVRGPRPDAADGTQAQ